MDNFKGQGIEHMTTLLEVRLLATKVNNPIDYKFVYLLITSANATNYFILFMHRNHYKTYGNYFSVV